MVRDRRDSYQKARGEGKGEKEKGNIDNNIVITLHSDR